jgi:hypothetical protein
MSFWSRFANVFRGERFSREIDEELRSHIEEAIEDDRDPAEARRALGSAAPPRSQPVSAHSMADSLRSVPFSAGDSSVKRGHQPSPFCRSDWHLARARAPSSIDALLLRPLPVRILTGCTFSSTKELFQAMALSG